ncbi:hypothetical protein [Metallosphaera hakonensis]|uniref:Uncharacterized protein n=1 Tax=Metallosphaera hakonensis JCM 8857 = DSM 7519 TaxID=1293036 RepID=A0A2U9ISH7_9CREN|nr:hypothetical protein [Metallosphaera hakonensis]AWR98968.1 hypothetical protein DFR87_03835 [Metallosphaera hakonensis JCM 8857 = DSM 7519]
MYQLNRGLVKAFFEAEWFSKIVLGRNQYADEIAALYLAGELPCPVVGRNIGVGFLRLGLEAVKWFHPAGSIVMPRAGLYRVPRPGRKQICVGCDWGISIRISENGKDLQDLHEVNDCPRIYVKPELSREFLEAIRESGYNVMEESLSARSDILSALGRN